MTELSRFLGTEQVQASQLGADLIVMGTHGRSGVDHLFLGSVAEKTLRTSPIPVMIVPPRAADVAPGGAAPSRSILCALDFSRDSARALAYAASLSRQGGGRLTLMHVVELLNVGYGPGAGTSFDLEGYQKAAVQPARQRLLDCARTVTAGTGAIDTVLGRGKGHNEILREAGERGADLIVAGVHGRNALDRLVFGSTTEQLVRRAKCPILTVPFKGEE